MKIAVIGSGNIGGTLARKWAAAGHEIRLGARNPSKDAVQQLLGELGSTAHAASIAEAATDAEVVVFAAPGAAMNETVSSIGATLPGKLVIDATNTIGGSGPINSLAIIQTAAPSAQVYRGIQHLRLGKFCRPHL